MNKNGLLSDSGPGAGVRVGGLTIRMGGLLYFDTFTRNKSGIAYQDKVRRPSVVYLRQKGTPPAAVAYCAWKDLRG
jgi:hypothetical protein